MAYKKIIFATTFFLIFGLSPPVLAAVAPNKLNLSITQQCSTYLDYIYQGNNLIRASSTETCFNVKDTYIIYLIDLIFVLITFIGIIIAYIKIKKL